MHGHLAPNSLLDSACMRSLIVKIEEFFLEEVELKYLREVVFTSITSCINNNFDNFKYYLNACATGAVRIDA